MRLRGVGMTLSGPEGSSPPLPFVTVDDNEGEALLALYPKSLRVVGDDVGYADPAPPPSDPYPVPVTDTAAEQAVAAWTTTTDADVQAVGAVMGGEVGTAENADSEPAGDIPTERDTVNAEFFDAFDLLEADDFVKTGPRKGKPKVDAVENILGRQSTMQEIDAAWAAREGAAA